MSRGKWASRVRALKGRGCAEVARKRADVGASMVGVRRREIRDGGLIGGVRRLERRRVCARRKWHRQAWPTGQRNRLTGPCQRERALGRARGG
jgi:hypothetical protein